jgi:hypothetical protein
VLLVFPDKKNVDFVLFPGNLRAKIAFNKSPEKDQTLIMFAESTCLLEIPKSGRVKLSFVPK